MKIQKILALLALAIAPFAFAEGPAKEKKADGDKCDKKSDCSDCEKGKKGPQLSKEEREKLKAARETAMKDPEVIKAHEAAKAAREKAQASKLPADREAAKAAMLAAHEATKAAMIKADPSVAEILAKLPAKPPAHGGKKGCDDCDGGKPGKVGDDEKGHGKGKGKPKADA